MSNHLGFGLGLRHQHYTEIINHPPAVDWFEIITENYMVAGGKPWYYLDKIRANYPLAMHGVSLSLGSTDPLNVTYLQDLKQLAQRLQPVWISDHLCWTGVHGYNLHDLMPLPYTEETIQHVVERICRVQDYLGLQILIENVSSYITFETSHLTEWEFLTAIAERADCLLLLDINNIFVSAHNHHYDATSYLNHLPAQRVQQIHLAGHSQNQATLIDTHDMPICDGVWDLYAHAIRRFGFCNTMIERDDNMPPLSDLLTELDIARQIAAQNQCAA